MSFVPNEQQDFLFNSSCYELVDGEGNSLWKIAESISDPINIELNNGGFKATLGAYQNLAIFKIFADYSFQEYKTLSTGIAISVR